MLGMTEVVAGLVGVALDGNDVTASAATGAFGSGGEQPATTQQPTS
ncbi:MAG: hypothetical protein QOI78_5663 [Actinomycetota bacterium]|nr:hypothetical protein [Actinomycetota bacterium]